MKDVRERGCVTKVLMHPHLKMAIENHGLTITEVVKGSAEEAMEALTHPQPETLGGIPIFVLNTMPENIIEFRDPNGKLVGAIYNLAMPVKDFS